MTATATDRLVGVTTSVAVKAPVQAVGTANVTLSGLQTVGGVALAEGDRVLLRSQTNPVENGIYVASATAWTRAKDFDGARDVVRGTIIVANFDPGTGLLYQVTTDNPITIGSSALVIGAIVNPNQLIPLTEAEAIAGAIPTNYAFMPGDVRRYGADPLGASDSSAAFVTADLVANAGGTAVRIPGGTYKWLTGITKKGLSDWYGDGIDRTIIKYYGNSIAIDAKGAAPVASRVICSMRGFTLDGTNSTGSAQGFRFGWNQRSPELLVDVKIFNFPHYGINFDDQNWIIGFHNILLDTCGHTTNDSSGIFKNASVDNSTWNQIVFNNVVAEECGNASSTAGGWDIRTTTTNRSVYLINCAAEANKGTDEALFQNLNDLQIVNIYMERTDVSGQSVGLDISGCSGGIFGGFITGAGANNLRGLRADNSLLTIDGADFGFWATSNLDLQSSNVHFGRNWTGQLGALAPLLPANIAITGNCQLTGLISPKFTANKNTTNQTGIVTNTFTKVTFTNEGYDPTAGYDAANSKFTPISLGVYQIDAQVTWVGGADQDTPIIAVYRNGAILEQFVSQNSGTAAFGTRISTQVSVSNVTDYFEIYVRQTSGVDQDISGSVADTWFKGSYLGQSV